MPKQTQNINTYMSIDIRTIVTASSINNIRHNKIVGIIITTTFIIIIKSIYKYTQTNI